VEVTAGDLGRVPAGNVRVPLEVFGAVWRAAEGRLGGGEDWYAAGVAATCRWVARAVVDGGGEAGEVAGSPVTRRVVMATPEMIEAELAAAERLAARRPVPAWLVERSGWSAGIEAALRWLWLGGEPPVGGGGLS
jgi:hypothetical protein